MATTTDAAFRVVCPAHTVMCRTEKQAVDRRFEIERLGACSHWHLIETRVDGEWLSLGIARAREVCAAKTGARVELPDGALVVCRAGWSRKTAERASAVAAEGSAEWFAALGPHEDADLTADGRGLDATGWCRCQPQPSADTWVRFERWVATKGRVAHGYACRTCRRITQTG